MRPSYEIRYACEDVPRPGPVSLLMVDGVWQKGRRPADAARYEAPIPIVESKPGFVPAHLSRKNAPGAGRPRIPEAEKLSPADRDARYRAKQAKIPCKDCGRKSWGNGYCQRDYKRHQRAEQVVASTTEAA